MPDAPGFQRPHAVDDMAACHFYHAMDLPELGSIEGNWDLRGRFADYVGHVAMRGRRALDVGTATGFLSFSAEAAGASVTSLDGVDGTAFDVLPHAGVRADPRRFAAEREDVLARTKNSYWFCHARLGSRARAYYANVYDLTPEIGDFDVVLVGQILVHLRSPLAALERVAARCRRTLVVTEGMVDAAEPIATFLGDPARPDLLRAWWHFSVPFFVRYLGILGFGLASRSRGMYRCRTSGYAEQIELTTLVFERP